MNANRPIGVFDSGVGGLTVYRALRQLMPHEDFVYLGDTARLPYATKSKQTIEACTIAAARLLSARDIKYFVVACNTAAAQSLVSLKSHLPALAHCGVVAAGAEAAVNATRNGRIAVLATEGTVRSGIYPDVIGALRPGMHVQTLACNLLVGLVEEGWSLGSQAQSIVSRYLSELSPGYDTLVLGCTHFPLLQSLFQTLCGVGVRVVDSAMTTALFVQGWLGARDMLTTKTNLGKTDFLVTDMPERFARLATYFLGTEQVGNVKLVDLSVLSLENTAAALKSVL